MTSVYAGESDGGVQAGVEAARILRIQCPTVRMYRFLLAEYT
jgi:hypothetical protein